jgi:hypothetical protein
LGGGSNFEALFERTGRTPLGTALVKAAGAALAQRAVEAA